ncbi:MAG TPA: type I DNA topoisomerase [Candidatus Saccharimonadales bacterium]|jgi:DNA topoisomerase-1|nr:type I DNA topoisomerase [Candidatus Saccharimonadales bacterium]
MSKQLVIVESPAKAKTIEKYLGSDYQVMSSFGHIRDLPKKHLNIDVADNFKPTYEISDDKKKVVASLKKATKISEQVWLASDEDREGEAIAWHLCYALGLDPKTTKRIVFHEITKPAIVNAIKHPRTIDLNLVNAQQARRILDRLVGYELSPVLWKKVRPQLSAGRVQSVAVKLIVEREREINSFESTSEYKISALFKLDNSDLPAELSVRFKDIDLTRKFLDDCIDSEFSVAKIDDKPGKRTPGTPFTTSTLQQEASRVLGYSVRQTMTIAQRLYENGIITYMRTDSPILSQQALDNIQKYIVTNFGQDYYHKRQFKSKQSSAQEAHEAIRPTDLNVTSVHDESQNRLYNLIWRRTIASQMTEAKLAKTEVTITINKRDETFQAKGEVVVFDGFLKVSGKNTKDIILPKLSLGQKLKYERIIGRQSFSKPKARYSEASLVKKLEELGIGRPSTYAPTISTIQLRGYVEKTDTEGQERIAQTLTLSNGAVQETAETEVYGQDKSKLLPTPTADVTTDFLVKNFEPIVDYDFTANAEKNFDLIAEGKIKWQEMLKNFYKDFHELIIKSDSVTREESTQTRLVGTDPKSGKPIFARYGRFGPMLQKGETTDEDNKPLFSSIPKGTTLETVTLEQAIEMFNLPRNVGKTDDGDEILANIGRFGPYIKIGSTFVSIKPLDPLTITESEARELYIANKEKLAKKYIKEFASGIKIVNGPYGPYITDGKKNAKIPKDSDENKLTEAEAKKILAEAPTKKRNFKRRAKKK